MSDGSNFWKAFDIVSKGILAAAGLAATMVYHSAQSRLAADQQQSQERAQVEQKRAQEEQQRIDEVRVVKDFFEPLTSKDQGQRKMAAAVIGNLADKVLVFRLANALPAEERAEALAVYGPEEVTKLAIASEPADVRSNAQAALDVIHRGSEPPTQSPGREDLLAVTAAPNDATGSHKSNATLGAPRATPSVQGFVYVGHWDGTNKVWLTRYLQPLDKLTPSVTPQSLADHKSLRVGSKTGAVYLRAGVPDANGRNSPSKGTIPEGGELCLIDAPKYNDGIKDNGYIWAKVSTPPCTRGLPTVAAKGPSHDSSSAH